jgi:hypothetical protein
VILATGVAVGVAVVLGARHHPPRPDATVGAYLAAWNRQDWSAMAALVERPAADFAAVHEAMVADLELTALNYRPGPVQVHGSTARTAYTAGLTLRGLGTWRLQGTLALQRRGRRWQVEWSPATVDPSLPAGGHFVRDRSWAPRAAVLGGDGTPLTGTTSLVTIGLEGSAVNDQAAMRTALAGAGATPAQITTALTQAAAHPDQFVPVLDVTEARYEQLRPTIYPVPGTRFVRHAGGAVTADLAAHVVGSVGPVSAEELKVLGDPYMAGDTVGQSGIESAYERQLAGAPGGAVRVVDAGGRVVATVATFAVRPGTAVRTTLDLRTQHAAEAALDGVPQPAALVAVRASTGEVLAVVSRPTATPFDRALEGRYPPGSTFKVITSTALLEAGLTPDSLAACPPTLTVDGRTFHNIDGEAAPSLPLHRAFAVSCNTAFIGLAGRLSGPALVSAASQFGFGSPVAMGLAAFGGRVPPPSGAVDEAATAIGQGRVEASPLMMATVAAAVDAGAAHAPRLVDGAADDTAPPRLLPPAAVDGLRAMMAEVVTNGTGTPAAVPGGLPVHGKTGTAEFGDANPPATHAWFIGYRGDTAFAVLVEGGGTGGPVAGPLAARFLEAR